MSPDLSLTLCLVLSCQWFREQECAELTGLLRRQAYNSPSCFSRTDTHQPRTPVPASHVSSWGLSPGLDTR